MLREAALGSSSSFVEVPEKALALWHFVLEDRRAVALRLRPDESSQMMQCSYDLPDCKLGIGVPEPKEMFPWAAKRYPWGERWERESGEGRKAPCQSSLDQDSL